MTFKCNRAYVDLDIGVALALHHAPHQVVLCNQILGLQQVNPQQPLEHEDCKCYTEKHHSAKHMPLGFVRLLYNSIQCFTQQLKSAWAWLENWTDVLLWCRYICKSSMLHTSYPLKQQRGGKHPSRVLSNTIRGSRKNICVWKQEWNPLDV